MAMDVRGRLELCEFLSCQHPNPLAMIVVAASETRESQLEQRGTEEGTVVGPV